MKILVDGEHFSITGHVHELLTITGLAQDGIKRRRIDGGASRYAILIAVELDNAAKRGLAAMSHVSRDHVTLPRSEESFVADNRTRTLSVIKAAAEIGISPGHLWRLIREEKDPALMLAIIPDSDPLRFDEIAIKAWAAGRPNRRSAA